MTRFTYRIMCGDSPEDSIPVEGEEIFTNSDAALARVGQLHNKSVDGPDPQNFWVETINPRD